MHGHCLLLLLTRSRRLEEGLGDRPLLMYQDPAAWSAACAACAASSRGYLPRQQRQQWGRQLGRTGHYSRQLVMQPVLLTQLVVWVARTQSSAPAGSKGPRTGAQPLGTERRELTSSSSLSKLNCHRGGSDAGLPATTTRGLGGAGGGPAPPGIVSVSLPLSCGAVGGASLNLWIMSRMDLLPPGLVGEGGGGWSVWVAAEARANR